MAIDNHDTIYLNHAGTSWPKPQPVLDAAASLWRRCPTEWPALFHAAHQTIAAFFHVDPARLLLTPSCTSALNLAIMDHAWTSADRVLSSSYEHHALDRTLAKLEQTGVRVTRLPPGNNELLELDALERELKAGGVRLVAVTAACNVTGRLLPISASIDLAHRFGAVVLVDGAQIAGWWDLNLVELGADLFTFAGHKGPQAPWGIGGLFVSPHISMSCPTATCELPNAQSPATKSVMPGYCDAGSVNLPALAGLAAGCRWLSEAGQQHRLRNARQLASTFSDAVRQIPGITIHDDVAVERKVPTVAVTQQDASSTAVAARLREHGVLAAGGFQCAPQAHQTLGTDRTGVIRFSFGPLHQDSEITRAVEILQQLKLP